MKSAARRRPSRYTQVPVVTSIAPSTVILPVRARGEDLRAGAAQRPAGPHMRQQVQVRLVLGEHHRPARQLQQPGHDAGHNVVMVRVAAGGQLGPPPDRHQPDPPVQRPRADLRPAQVPPDLRQGPRARPRQKRGDPAGQLASAQPWAPGPGPVGQPCSRTCAAVPSATLGFERVADGEPARPDQDFPCLTGGGLLVRQVCALTERLATDDVRHTREASGHGWGEAPADEVTPNCVSGDLDRFPCRDGVVEQDHIAADLVDDQTEPVGRHSAYREVAADRVALDRPGNNLPPPPVSVTLPLTVNFAQQNGVRVGGRDVPVDGDGGVPGPARRRTALPRTCQWYLSAGSPGRAMSPCAAVTLCPTVMVDGALCASSMAPAGDIQIADDVDHGIGRTAHAPVTVMLA